MGVTNALGPATSSNSYCYMQMKSTNIVFGVKDGGTFVINHGVDPTTGVAGSVSFTTSDTETTVSNNLNVSGTSRINNISTNANTILLGNTNQDGASTVQNSHSWVELKTEKLAMAGPYVEIRHSSTATGAAGTTGILVQAAATTIKNNLIVDGTATINTDFTVTNLFEVRTAATAIKNNLIVDGTAAIDDEMTVTNRLVVDQIKTNTAQNIGSNGSNDATINVDDGILLLDGGTGRGYTNANGVLQVNARNADKLVDCAAFRSQNDNNNILNFCRESNGTVRGRVDGNGANSVSYRTSSDRRLKENIVTMDSCWDLVKELKPRCYNWIDKDHALKLIFDF